MGHLRQMALAVGILKTGPWMLEHLKQRALSAGTLNRALAVWTSNKRALAVGTLKTMGLGCWDDK